MKKLENEMHKFVKDHINEFPSKHLIALNHLRRFEGLNFDCLSVEHRYVDIAVSFINEINSLKDS